MKKYIFKYKLLFIINIIIIIFSSASEVYISVLLKDIIDTTSSGDFSKLYSKIVQSLLFIIAVFIIGYTRRLIQSIYTKKTLLYLKDDIFKYIMNKSIKSFNEVNSSQYISTLTNDINMIKEEHIENIFNIIFDLVGFIVAIIIIVQINVYIALIILAVSFLPLLIPVIFGKKMSNLKKSYSDELGFFTTKIKDIFSGFEVIKSFNISNVIKQEYEHSNTALEKSRYKSDVTNSLISEISQNCGFLVYFVILGVGSYFIIKKMLTFGSLYAIIDLMGSIVNPAINISSRISKIKSVALIEDKIIKLINEKSNNDAGLVKSDFTDSISFENVSFSYDSTKKVLNGINLNIKKGCKYALVGSSGCGKSTLLKLLLRYYDNYEGTIKIDGVDNKLIKLDSIHNLISIIHQNVFMFEGSIKQNITLFRENDEINIDDIINLSGLDDFIKNLPNGIETSISENGNNLSGGEKQRISIARALVNNTPIIVLDEATSALDNETAFNIESSILNLENTTCLVVTHKLVENILNKYDKILVLKNGEICESGSFEELMNLKGYFYSLYNVSNN
ncbi:ABC transporter ATP-binding protein [Clostridium sp.]|uniref:ABC transporter ATP-binding protein n=1 Tax=Clostridium sp. TaxID=1506 RepID=UPI002FDC8D83